jgi:hypothetical protein
MIVLAFAFCPYCVTHTTQTSMEADIKLSDTSNNEIRKQYDTTTIDGWSKGGKTPNEGFLRDTGLNVVIYNPSPFRYSRL